MNDCKVKFRNRRADTAGERRTPGTRYDVHRATDDCKVGEVAEVDGLWFMFLETGSHCAPLMDGERPARGGNREGCGQSILFHYERDVEPAMVREALMIADEERLLKAGHRGEFPDNSDDDVERSKPTTEGMQMTLTLKQLAEGIRRTGAAISGTLAGDYVYWPADVPALHDLRDMYDEMTHVSIDAYEAGETSASMVTVYVERLIAFGLLEEVTDQRHVEERRRLIDEADAKREAEGRKPIPEFKHVALSWDSYGWLLETLRDLAPVEVAAAMVTDGMVEDVDDEHEGATWTYESERTDPHENMGAAVAGIVAELVANEDGLESLAARLYTHIGSNGQEFEADELLEEFNGLIEHRYPRGHRGLF